MPLAVFPYSRSGAALPTPPPAMRAYREMICFAAIVAINPYFTMAYVTNQSMRLCAPSAYSVRPASYHVAPFMHASENSFSGDLRRNL
jgi:hypothetical protein